MINTSTGQKLGEMLIRSQQLHRKLALAILGISIFSSFSFIITYSFLFGYYFGGDIDEAFSNFEVFRRFIPFHLNTLTFTYFMIALSVAFATYSINFFRESNRGVKFIVIFCFIIFHLLITAFFTESVTLNNLLYFSAIWILPLFISAMILLIIRGGIYPFKAFSGILYGVTLIIVYSTFVSNNLQKEIVVLWLYVSMFILSTVMTYVPYKKSVNFLFIYPYLFIILSIIIHILPIVFFPHLIKVILIYVLPLIVSIIISYYSRNKFIQIKFESKKQNDDKSSITKKIVTEFILILSNPKTHKGGIMFIILCLLGIYVLAPRISSMTAKVIRDFNPASNYQIESIIVKNIDGKKITTKGRIIAEQDGVLYLSNQQWKLEQIKTDKYFVVQDTE